MSIKIKHALLDCLNKIKYDSFDEDTIRTLLITSREYLKHYGLIKELAHFIAHPKRDQGLFLRKVNCRYTKLKLSEKQLLKVKDSYILSQCRTEEDLSRFMLGAVNNDKVDAKLFQILYHDGLEDLSEGHLMQYTGLNKKQAEKFFREHFIKKDNYYHSKASLLEQKLAFLNDIPRKNNDNDQAVEQTIREGTGLVNKMRGSADLICGVVRGAVQYSSVFDSKALGDDFQNNFKEVLKKFDIDLSYSQHISDRLDNILLCLMALLHDAAFEFYDKNQAKVYLCYYFGKEADSHPSDSAGKEQLFQNGVLALYITYKYHDSTTSCPMFVSDLKISDYIDSEDFFSDQIGAMELEIPWITAKRIDGKLKLKSYSPDSAEIQQT